MLLLLATDGEILDSTGITREDFDNLSPIGAHALIRELSPGSDAR
jgi:hypothetical protein